MDMSDDKSNAGPADRSRINVHEDYELRYWSDKFGVSHDALKQAVAKVGPVATTVEQHLKAA
jgi:hypothetical protein